MNDPIKPVLAPDGVANRTEDDQRHAHDAPTTTYDKLIRKMAISEFPN